MSAAARELALAELRRGYREESLDMVRNELSSPDGPGWLGNAIVRCMEEENLSVAGDLAKLLTAFQRGSEWHAAPAESLDDVQLTLPKLRHDVAQLAYLRSLNAIGTEFDEVIAGYRATLERHAGRGDNVRFPLGEDDRRCIGRVYGRVVHLAEALRLDHALAPGWDRGAAQHAYSRRPGVVVIDNFLTTEALAQLQRFCLESTVWFGNRYADGRLGAFFFTGFNCPLLLQIAEEIRDALPEVIGSRYPLRQLWGFKNTCDLPAHSTIHADFAAVNVNFWLTPTSANLDPTSGGMVIYDIDAPPSWDFASYNERIDLIRWYLATRRPGVIRVPYRQNRAVIFNSDLFHATEAVRFDPSYRNHRINITMLYGERSSDAHHPAADTDLSGPSSSWRSAAFSRARR